MKIKYKEIIFISKNLSVYLKSGIPISNALFEISKEIKDKNVKNSILDIRSEVSKGSSLFKAFKKYKTIYPSMMLLMINIGEMTGNMDKVLLKVSDYYEKVKKERDNRTSSMAYPLVVFIMMIIFMFIFVVFMYPQMYDSLSSGGNEESTLSSCILDFSIFVRENTMSFLIIILSIVILIMFIKSLNVTKEITSKLEQKSMLYKINKELSFIRMMYLMTYSGVPISRFISIYLDLDMDKSEKDEIQKFYGFLEKGMSMSDALKNCFDFSSVTLSLIQIGENTGALEEKLKDICDMLEEKYYRKMKMITSLVQPISFIVLGVMILFIFLLVYNTIYGGMILS